jgi:hypothetical protein
LANIERIDEENERYYAEFRGAASKGDITVKDVLGFEIKDASVFVSHTNCGVVCSPSNLERNEMSIFSLLPLYDSIIYPIPTKGYGKTITSENFKEFHAISLKDFIEIVHKRRVIPYFTYPYSEYDKELAENFLETGIPRISYRHLDLIKSLNICKNAIDCNNCKKVFRTANSDISELMGKEIPESSLCSSCLNIAYIQGITKEQLSKLESPNLGVCAIPDIIASRKIGSVFQSNCRAIKETLGLFSSPNNQSVEMILDGLKVKYTNELEIDSYIELLDGKTTKAVRQAINQILKDPLTSKFSERLNAAIFEYNNEVEEVAKSRAAKFFNAISEMTVFGSNSLLERETNGLIKFGERPLKNTKEALASAMLDAYSTITGKGWSVAQIYKTHCKIENLKKSRK